MAPAGYSGTPLPKKLGIKAGGTVVAIAEPASFPALLERLVVRKELRSAAGGGGAE